MKKGHGTNSGTPATGGANKGRTRQVIGSTEAFPIKPGGNQPRKPGPTPRK